MSRRSPFCFFLLSILMMIFTACSSDSGLALPDYFMGYATILRRTPNSDEFLIRLDDWKEYPLDISSVNMNLSGKDSARIICYYTKGKSELNIEGNAPINPTLKLISVAPAKIPSDVSGTPIHQDNPISFVSMSKGAYYLNFLLKVSVQEKEHLFYVGAPFVVYDALGKVHLTFRLYHDQNGDYPAYYSRVYMSIPLYSYWDVLQNGGSVTVQYIDESNLLRYHKLMF